MEEGKVDRHELDTLQMSHTAELALQKYHGHVRGRILGQALVESSTVAAAAVQELSQSHTHVINELNSQIAGLQEQLVEATAVIETLGGRIAAGDVKTSAASPSVVRGSFALDVNTTTTMTTTTTSTTMHEQEGDDSVQKLKEAEETRLTGEQQEEEEEQEHQKQQQQQQKCLPSVGETESDAFRTAQSGGRGTGGTMLSENDAAAYSALFAEVVQLRGREKLHHQQQATMGRQIKELTALLSKVVKENAVCRQEVQLLRATTVPLEEHRQLLSERDVLERENNCMKIELRCVKEELEMAVAATHSPQQQEQQQLLQKHVGGASMLDLGLIHDEAAPATLKNQPVTSSTSTTTTVRADDDMTSEKDYPFHSIQSLETEDSAPVTSLNEENLHHEGLWKTAIRELEQQAVLAATQLSAAEQLREAENRIEELHTLNKELRRSLETLEAEDKCVREDCEKLTFRNAVLSQQVASLLVRVERQRRALERRDQSHSSMNNVESVSDSEMLLAGEEPYTNVHNRQVERRRGLVASAVQSLLENRGAVSASGGGSNGVVVAADNNTNIPAGGRVSSLLDVTFQPTGPLEVEGGLRSGLDVFARGPNHRLRRSLMLRNLGSPLMEVDVTRVPRLPQADLLSGVALGRPPRYTRIDPTPPTETKHGGDFSGSYMSNNNNNNNGSSSSDENSSGGDTRTFVVSENTEENRHFLELLREDENLDRYSINSVTELLQRNQELVQQLYVATQRADVVEKNLRRGKRGREEMESPSASDTEAAQPPRNVHRRDEREQTSSSSSDKRDEEEVGKSWGSGESGDTSQRHETYQDTADMELQEVEEQNDGRVEERDINLEMDERYLQLKVHVYEHIDAVLRKHEAQMISADNGLASSLLRVMEVGDKYRPIRGSGTTSFFSHRSSTVDSTSVEPTTPTTTSTLKDAMVTSLIRSCTEMGIRAANQAVALATAEKTEHGEMMKKCWEEAQRVLQRSVADLQTAITSLSLRGGESTGAKPISEEVVKEEAGCGNEQQSEVELLNNITSLLHSACLKEHTIQRVMQLAIRRQKKVQGVCIKSQKEKEKHQQQKRDKDDYSSSDDDDDLNEEENPLQQLRVQLQGVQTQYEKILAEYHEERKKHTVLLDNMWRIEEEKVEAVRSREEVLERMASMMTREEYEATVAALDSSKATIEDLEAQLRYAQETNNQQLAEIDRWQRLGAENERQRAEEAGVVTAKLSEKDRLIAQLVQQQHQFELCNTDQLARIHQLEANAAQQREKLASQYENEQALRDQLHRVELALLEQQCTQDLLFAIFPGDRALAENRNLIQAMREEKEQLAETVASLQLELDRVQRDLAAAQLEIHAAEQARQEAELKLQEMNFIPWEDATSATLASGAVDVHAVELEVLQRTNAALLIEKRDWIEREALLREQLAALGRDPVSENARRYGLKATRNFEEQLQELHERCVRLQAQLKEAEGLSGTVQELTNKMGSLTLQLNDTKSELEVKKEYNLQLEEEKKKMLELLHQKEESHDAVMLTLAEKDEMIDGISGAISTLEKEVEKMEERLRKSDEEKQRLYSDNVKLIKNVSALMEDVEKKETERKAAQAALAKGLASASASLRWRGRRTRSSGVVPQSPSGFQGKTSN